MATPKSKPAGKVQVQIPANLEPIYANFALITNSASEIVIDFAQVMPQVPTARVRITRRAHGAECQTGPAGPR